LYATKCGESQIRYYKVVLTSASGSAISAFPNSNGGATWCSQVNGGNDPGALDAELDIVQFAYHAPGGGSFFRLYGVPLSQITQSANLNMAAPNQTNIDIYVGMATGLPLANPAQQGLVVSGTVFPGFGNWIGTAQTIDLILAPIQSNSANTPINIVHNQPAGMPMGTAVQNALTTAFPNVTPKINVSSNLVFPNAQTGIFGTLAQYAGWVKEASKSILGGTYSGIFIGQNGKNIVGFDNQSLGSSSTKTVAFNDLIGQPTWYGLNQIFMKTVMRGDIGLGDTVMLPNTIATVQAQSAPQFRQNSGFQGKFFVQKVRHMGRFRQPTGEAWVSVFDLVSLGNA
jgi:hypothetical protein